MRAFGRALQGMRIERGVTREALAAAVGKSNTWICDLELGGKMPPGDLTFTARLAEVLGAGPRETRGLQVLALARRGVLELPIGEGPEPLNNPTDLELARAGFGVDLLRAWPSFDRNSIRELAAFAGTLRHR